MTEIIKVDEFQRVCRLAKLVEIKAGMPVYATKDKTEGIELKAGKIITFSVKDGERDYKAAITSKDIIAVVGAFSMNEHEPQKPEQKAGNTATEDMKEPENKTDDKELVGMMPNTLTKELISKWAMMPVAERLIMLQNTDPSQIEVRKGRAGQSYKYVPISYMIKCANMAFGFAWSVHITSWTVLPTEIICALELKADIAGTTITKSAIGQKDIAFKKDTTIPLCIGDDYKSAEADGIKKALSLFGIAQDVYSGEV